jgi:hypothetical protein
MRAQYKINKIESKSNKTKESSNARADDNFKKIFTSDRMTWIQYCFPNITLPGTGNEKARTSCNVKNRESLRLTISGFMHQSDPTGTKIPSFESAYEIELTDAKFITKQQFLAIYGL